MPIPEIHRSAPTSDAGIYYGWWVVGVTMLAGFIVYGLGLYSFTLFIRPLTDEFGWSRAMTGGAFSIFWVTAPLALLAGTLIHRIGIRRLFIGGIVLECVALMLVMFVSSLWELLVLRALMGLGKVLVAITIPVLLSYWFSLRYGFALALSLAAWHLGGLVLVPITQILIESYGWRSASTALGAIALIAAIPAAALVLRVIRPQQIGLFPDGRIVAGNDSVDVSADNVDPSQDGKIQFLRNASNTASFWIIMIATVVYYLTFASVIAHEAAFISDIGLSPKVASNAVSLTAGMAMIGLLLTGTAIDHLPLRAVLLAVFAIFFVALLSLLGLSFMSSTVLFFVFVLTFGFAGGGIDVTLISTVKRCFGEPHFAYFNGILYFCLLSGFLIGPVFAGLMYDLTSSYTTAFGSVFAALAVAFLGIFFIQIPTQDEAKIQKS